VREVVCNAGLRRWSVLVLLASGVSLLFGGPGLVAAPSALAHTTANSTTFTDARGDNTGGSPDVTTVGVSNDDDGVLEFRLEIPNRTDLVDADFVTVYLDTDRSDSTGCNVGAGAGLDWSLVFHGHAAPAPDSYALLRSTNDCRAESAPSTSLVGMFDGATSTLTLHVNAAEVGNPKAFRLLVIASTGPIGPEAWDIGGDTTAWIYNVVLLTRDTVAPQIKALASHGVRGGSARLRYTVFEDTGRAREELVIYRGGHKLGVRRTKLGNRSAAAVYVQSWKVPAGLSGALRFCVRAWDAAGNRSGQSCARLTIR
jgi:hypothetical protein